MGPVMGKGLSFPRHQIKMPPQNPIILLADSCLKASVKRVGCSDPVSSGLCLDPKVVKALATKWTGTYPPHKAQYNQY